MSTMMNKAMHLFDNWWADENYHDSYHQTFDNVNDNANGDDVVDDDDNYQIGRWYLLG